MRIGIFYSHLEHEGGMPREWRRLIQELAGLKVEVIVYCYKGVCQLERMDGVLVRRYLNNQHLPFVLPKELKRDLVNDASALDLLEIVGSYFPENISVAHYVNKLGVPYVIAPLGHLAPITISRSPIKKKLFLKLLLVPVIKKAVGIHAISPVEELCVRSYVEKPVVVTTFGNFSDDVPVRIRRDYFKSRLLSESEAIVFLYMGRLDVHWKGLLTLLEAYYLVQKSRPDTKLLIIGPDEDNGREQLFNSIKRLDMEGSVMVLDTLGGDEKFDALASADLFVYPSRRDSIPRVIREALSVGCPCLVSPETLTSHIVLEYGAGGCCEVNKESIAEQMLSLTENESLLESMRENALRACMEGFNWVKQAIALRDGFQKFLDNK